VALYEKKFALVTNVEQGPGEAVARLLQQKGFIVFGSVAASQRESVATRAPAGRQQLLVDLHDTRSILAASRTVESAAGKLDLLVTIPPSCDEHFTNEGLTVEGLRAALEAGVIRPASIIDAFLPFLKASGRGRIVVTSSAVGSVTNATPSHPAANAFRVTMTALNALTQAYARELAPYGIKVNAVAPDAGILGAPVQLGPEADDAIAQLIVQLGGAESDGPTGGFFTTFGRHAW